MPFKIIVNRTDASFQNANQTTIYECESLESREYADAEIAKAAMNPLKNWCKAYGHPTPKMRIQRIVTAAWEDREAKRMQDGTYKLLPEYWREAYWWTNAPVAVRKHFTHVSDKDPSKVAFTASPEDGERDRQTVLSPSVYLARYFGEVLTQRDIRDIGSLLALGKYGLKIANGPEDFERVYENSPEVCADGSDYASCMRYGRDHFGTNRHPAYAYGAGDLAIAWIEEEDGNIAGRAVIWPTQKSYVRVYGITANHQALMHSLLRAEGYSHESDFRGAKMLKVSVAPGEVQDATLADYFLMPYLDGNRHRNLKPEGEFFVLCDVDDYPSGEETSGRTTVWKQIACAKTGRQVSARDAIQVDNQWYSRSAMRDVRLNYCENLSHATVERVQAVFQGSYSRNFRESHIVTLETYLCERAGVLADAATNPPIRVNTRNGIQTWDSVTNRGAYRCEEDGTYWQRGYRPTREEGSEFTTRVASTGADYSGTVTGRYVTRHQNIAYTRFIGEDYAVISTQEMSLMENLLRHTETTEEF